MVAPCLYSLRRNWPETVLAEPDSRAPLRPPRLRPRAAVAASPRAASCPASRPSLLPACVRFPQPSCFSRSNFYEVNALRIVRAQAVSRISGRGNVARWTSALRASACPPRRVCARSSAMRCDRPRRDPRPRSAHLAARGARDGSPPSVIKLNHRIAISEAHLVANRRMQLILATPGIAFRRRAVSCGCSTTSTYIFFIANVTPDMLWSLRIGKPIIHVALARRILASLTLVPPHATDCSSYPATSLP